VDWQTFVLGLGTFASAAGGCVLVVHEFRRRDRRALNDEVAAMSGDLAELRHDLVACRRYAFDLANRLTDNGLHAPEPPELKNR
jgi:hypothetical protein